MKIDPHETFNARNYTFEEVAERFVATGDFAKIASNQHAVLLGPRGSGKTTLFKMLTLAALHKWSDDRAHGYLDKLRFYAIYVPSDILWHHQLGNLEKQASRNESFRMISSRAAVLTNIFLSVTDCFQGILSLEFANIDTSEAEVEIAKFLIDIWDLGPSLPMLSAVKIRLEARMSDVRTFLNRVVDHNLEDPSIHEIPDWYYYDFMQKVGLACSKVSSLLNLRRSHWALCFDELELAPEWLQEDLFGRLRSTDQRFLLKLSASPIPRILGKTRANQLDDFQLIRMWPHSSQKYKKFCDDLTKRLLKERFGQDVDTCKAFGRSILADEDDYSRGSANWTLFRDSATWDRSFRTRLSEFSPPIDPEDPVPFDSSQRDKVHRKAKPIVTWRRAYLKSSGGRGIERRSRKGPVPELYSGMDAIYAITDGNPRRVISIASRLADLIKFDKYSRVRLIPPESQGEILYSFSTQYSAYIKALPEAYFKAGERTYGLFDLLKNLGSFFHDQICGRQFNLDPYGSFYVDEWLPDDFLEVLRTAAWHGAIVHIDDNVKRISSDIRGKRFRLSYSLAPSFGLLMSKHRAKNIASCSSILKPVEGVRNSGPPVESPQQPDLFE
ncbi:MAG: hypothetical protein JNJ70_16460 [Verrucomicrobiales bacterium]|nr:hypothetical protein [Verrucomicrobiales bacterium]